MRKNVFILTLILILFGLTNIDAATNKKTVKVFAQPSKSEVSIGDNFFIKVTIEFEKTWFTYDLSEQISADGIGPTTTEITITPEALLKISGEIIRPKPKSKYDDGFEMNIKYYKGTIVFEIPVKALKDISFKDDSVSAVVYMQLCDPTKCLPPEEYIAQVSSDSYSESGSSIFSFLWFAISAGALALLTPCVFPMVPITVSFFAKRSEVAKGKGLRDALVYALGIIITFTSLGFIFSVAFGASGIQEFAKSPYVYLFIAGIFLLFTFNLFGAYEIQMPTGLMNKLNAKSQQGSGIGSVILMGLTFSLASFSCTGPLVGAALISASQGEWFYPIISMLAFSTTLATPFFLLALFPSTLSSLPKAGGWMNNMKVVLGFIVLATTLYFVNNALLQWDSGLSRELFLSIWIAIFALTTLYLLGVFKLKMDTPLDTVGSFRLIFVLIFATLTFYLVAGLFGMKLGEFETYVPQSEHPIAASTISATGTESLAMTELSGWIEDYEEGIKIAKEENKPIFLDFTGRTCTNCKKMEKKIFPLQSIRTLLDKMVKIKLITDVNEEPYITYKNMQLEKYSSVAIPLYVILTFDGEEIARMNFTNSESEFKEFLNKAF